MPTAASIPPRAAFPLTVQQARAATTVVFPKLDAGDRLTPHLDKMVEGDQWLRARGWFGPWPSDATPEGQRVRDETRRSFTSRNVLAEAITRHAAAVLGREPRWDFVSRKPLGRKAKLTDAEKASYQTLIAALTAWWDVTKPHREMKKALRYALYMGRACVRPYVHLGRLAQLTGAARADDGAVTIPPIDSLDAALALIAVEAVHPRSGAVVASAVDGTPVSVVFYDEVAADGLTRVPRVEWTYLTTDRRTLLVDEPLDTFANGRPVTNGLGQVVTGRPALAATLQLGARVPVVQIERDPLITPPCLQQQASLNFALTVLPRVLGDAGWMERIFLNVEPPGTWEYDPNGARVPNSFRPSDFIVGRNTTNFMHGTVVENEGPAGPQQSIATPSVVHRPPVDPDFAIKSARAIYVAFLEEVSQSHIMLTQEGEASGLSHEEARNDFDGTCEDSVSAVNPAGRALLEAVVALAEDLLGAPGQWTDAFRAEFQCRLSRKRTAAEEQADSQAVTAGRLSRSTAMERGQIDDTDAELQRIADDPLAQLDELTKRATLMGVLVMQGDVDRLTAAKIAGMPASAITLIDDAPPPAPLGPQPVGAPPAAARPGAPVARPPAVTNNPVARPGNGSGGKNGRRPPARA